MAPLVPVIRRYLSAALAVLVILVALADPANREALEQSRRADDIATDPRGGDRK